MQKRQSFLPIFLIFTAASLIVVFLSSHHMFFGQNLLEDGIFPLQNIIFRLVVLPGNLFKNTTNEKLQTENLSLHQQLANVQQLEEDNKALRDQFETTSISSSSLLPARVIGDPQFFPGVSSPEILILDKGEKDGVRVGDTVVYKNNIVGTVSRTTDTASQITVVSNKATSITAQTSKTEAQGVLSGQGNGVMVLGSVVLSESLQKDDMVITSGSQDINKKGYPPGLIIGRIMSVNRDPSSLYQSASVKSLLQIEKLTTVFILKGN